MSLETFSSCRAHAVAPRVPLSLTRHDISNCSSEKTKHLLYNYTGAQCPVLLCCFSYTRYSHASPSTLFHPRQLNHVFCFLSQCWTTRDGKSIHSRFVFSLPYARLFFGRTRRMLGRLIYRPISGGPCWFKTLLCPKIHKTDARSVIDTGIWARNSGG